MTSATILILGSLPFQADSSPCADVFGPSAWAAEVISAAVKAATAALYNLLMRNQLCRKIIEGKLMPTWLRSLVNAILGKVPGKTSRLDTAT
jgi:hypothetical protein